MTEEQGEAAPHIPRSGSEVSLTKRALKHGAKSEIDTGQTLQGKLVGEVRVGEPIHLSTGAHTSPVRKIRIENGRTLIETATSLYELASAEKERAVVLANKFGSIDVPASLQDARLNDEVFNQEFGPHRVRINKPALKGVLLEVEGAQIFKAVNRLMVLAKVGNIHVPFYISSKGTDGKREGEWYPFFGYTGDWLAKGDISANGQMEYSPEISRVQALLNENLILPKDYISPSGMLGTGTTGPYGAEPKNVLFDLNQHLRYRNYLLTDEARNSKNREIDEMRFVQRMTGYRPDSRAVNPHDNGVYQWIGGIVKRI